MAYKLQRSSKSSRRDKNAYRRLSADIYDWLINFRRYKKIGLTALVTGKNFDETIIIFFKI